MRLEGAQRIAPRGLQFHEPSPVNKPLLHSLTSGSSQLFMAAGCGFTLSLILSLCPELFLGGVLQLPHSISLTLRVQGCASKLFDAIGRLGVGAFVIAIVFAILQVCSISLMPEQHGPVSLL